MWLEFIVASMFIFIGSIAMSGQLNLDMRVDADSATFNSDANINAGGTNWGVSNYSRVYIQTGRLDYLGKFNDDLSYRVRVRFAGKNATDLTYKDSSGSPLDLAYVSYKWSDVFTLEAGKMLGDLGGFDRMTPSPDTYFTSREYTDLQTNGALFETGARFIFSFGDHHINLFAGNTFGTADSGVTAGSAGTASPGGITGATNTATFNQNHLAYGVVYLGAFLDKTLNVIGSYYGDSPQDTTRAGANRQDTYTTAGVKYNVKVWYLRFDYDLYSYGDKATNGHADSTTDAVGEFAYNFMERQWIKITGESSAVTTNPSSGPVTANWTTYGAAYEYHPFNDETFRYHVAYTSTTESIPSNAAANPNTNPTRTDLFAGFRVYADFLK